MPVSFSQAADKYDVVIIGSGLGDLPLPTDWPIADTKSFFSNITASLAGLPPGLNVKGISLMFPSMDSLMEW